MRKNIKKFSHDLINKIIKEKNINNKLEMAHYYSLFMSINYSQTYSSKYFEEEMIKISNLIIAEELNADNINCYGTLHVMTEAYETGGHTRVVNNWIKMNPHKNSIFFNTTKTNLPDFLKETIKKNNGEIIFNEGTNIIEKANFLNKISKGYERIILHLHSYDFIPLLAFGVKNFNKPIFLYNHADHVWGVNYSICDYILDLSNEGKKFSNKYRGIPLDKIKIVSIPIDVSDNKAKIISENKIKKIVSMAAEIKFNSINDYDFQKFLSDLLSNNKDIYYEIIGVSPDSQKWNEIKNKYRERLILHGLKTKDEVKEILSKADLYVDSFPMNSYTCVLDAILLEIPVVSLKTSTMTLDSLKDITEKNIEDLLKKINTILVLSYDEKLKIIEKNKISLILNHGENFWRENINYINTIKEHKPLVLQDNIVFDDYIKKYSDFYYQIFNQKKLHFYVTKVSISNRFKMLKISIYNGMAIEIISLIVTKIINKIKNILNN